MFKVLIQLLEELSLAINKTNLAYHNVGLYTALQCHIITMLDLVKKELNAKNN